MYHQLISLRYFASFLSNLIPLHVNPDWTVRFLLVSKTYGAFTSLWWHCVDRTLYIPALLDTDMGGRGLLWPRTHVEVGSITPEQNPWAPRCFSYASCPSAIQPAVPPGEAAPSAGPWSDDGIGAELQLLRDDLSTPQGINLCFYRPKIPKQNRHPNWSSLLPRHEDIKGLGVKSIKLRNLFGYWIQLRFQSKSFRSHQVSWKVNSSKILQSPSVLL